MFIMVNALVTPDSWFSHKRSVPVTLNEINISTEYKRLKNPKWRDADQLAIYKHDREIEQGST